jgi:hypothetical protein
LRCLRMKREMHQPHVDFKILLQFLNTPGTEVAPGSHIIREDFQRDTVGHRSHSFTESLLPRWPFLPRSRSSSPR